MVPWRAAIQAWRPGPLWPRHNPPVPAAINTPGEAAEALRAAGGEEGGRGREGSAGDAGLVRKLLFFPLARHFFLDSIR